MAIELIKAKHFPLSLVLMLSSYALIKSVLEPIASNVESLIYQLTYVGCFFAISLPAVGLQYLENKYLWRRILDFNDNLSFMGLSLGFAVGLISLGIW